MELNLHSTSSLPQPAESRSDQWQVAAVARKEREAVRAQQPGTAERVIEAYKVERLNHKNEARELRPITYDNSHLNKVRSFLTVAQNGMQARYIDVYA